MSREFVKRAALLGAIAWASLCLMTAGLVPELHTKFSHIWVLSGLFGLASAVGLVEVVKRDQERYSESMDTRRRPRHDELTGLPNRWEFDRLINIMIADAQDHDLSLSLVIIDVDAMKNINLKEGYSTGDEILQEVTRSIVAATRGADLLCRYGDDEFAVLLSDLDARSCETVVRRLRSHLQDRVSIKQPVTVSLGAASLQKSDSANCLVRRAELALFRSKSDGRDRGCYHDGQQLLELNTNTPATIH